MKSSMKRTLYIFLFFLGFVIIIEGCTDLDEEVIDEALTIELTDEEANNGLLVPIYGIMYTVFNHTNYFSIQEISTDEAILPYRGGTDWGDNGIYTAMHQHVSNSTDPNLRNTWNALTKGVSYGVTALNELPNFNIENTKTYIAEARGLKAFYSMLLLDLYGITFSKDDANERSVVLRGAEAVEYLKNEFLAAEPDLRTDVGPGRLTKGAVWGLLARLHMNAAVYRDRYAASFNFTTEDMDQVISYCDKIITSGQYQLASDYFSIFGNNNHDNKELIFAVDQRADIPGSHNRMAYFSLSGDQFPLAAYPAANGTDGPAITPDFYQTWVAAANGLDPTEVDPRFHQENLDPTVTCISAADYNINRGILRGQQYGLIRVSGAFVKCPDGVNYKVDKLYSLSRSRPDLAVDFTEDVGFGPGNSNYSNGFRVEKYEFSKSSDTGRNRGEADISLLRLADIYLLRAEAKLRKNNDGGGALSDVNAVRAARTSSKGVPVTPPPALTEMNLDLLFRERGFELYWEMVRRTDMIRFGKYEGTWTEKTNTDKQKRIFPIPQTAIDGATSVPGYIIQNPSY
jgi:starch-binding outer membrane protein, SusD/RagB family